MVALYHEITPIKIKLLKNIANMFVIVASFPFPLFRVILFLIWFFYYFRFPQLTHIDTWLFYIWSLLHYFTKISLKFLFARTENFLVTDHRKYIRRTYLMLLSYSAMQLLKILATYLQLQIASSFQCLKQMQKKKKKKDDENIWIEIESGAK